MSERALRHNKGKPPLYYLLTFPEAIRGVARVSAYGEAKYARFNYLKGAPASESVSCLMRHLLAWYNGEDVDPESGLNHLDAVAWNALRLTDELKRRPSLDDRPCVAPKVVLPKVTEAAMPNLKSQHHCDTCRYFLVSHYEEPCDSCNFPGTGSPTQWTPK